MLDNKTRLNTPIRQAVVAKALETSGVLEEEKLLIELRAELASKICKYAMDKEGHTEASIRKLVDNSNESAFISIGTSNARYVSANLNGKSVQLQLNGQKDYRGKSHIEIKYPSEGGPLVPYDRVDVSDASYWDDYFSLEQRQTAVEQQRKVIETTVAATLKRVTTVGKLLEVWPAAVDLLPAEYIESTGTALAIDPKALNALCGIPSNK